MNSNSLGKAILKAKCPHCRQGDMFAHPWYKISRFYQANKHCPVCNFRFEIEPGFFFGAMYMSYAFVVAIIAIVGTILYFALKDPPVIVYVIGINLVVFLFLPLIFRYSRVLYLYLFGGVFFYEGES